MRGRDKVSTCGSKGVLDRDRALRSDPQRRFAVLLEAARAFRSTIRPVQPHREAGSSDRKRGGTGSRYPITAARRTTGVRME